MAIAFTDLTEGTGAGVDDSTASVTWAADRLQLLAVAQRMGSSTAPNQPTATATGLTWTVVLSNLYDNSGTSRYRITLFRAMGSGATGATTIDYGGQSQVTTAWSWCEFSGVDTGGTHGSGAVVQSAQGGSDSTGTSLTVTLAAFGSLDNATYGCIGVATADANIVVGTGFTELADLSPGGSHRHQAQYLLGNDTTVDWSWATSSPNGGIAIEIKATVAAPSTQIDDAIMRGVIVRKR